MKKHYLCLVAIFLINLFSFGTYNGIVGASGEKVTASLNKSSYYAGQQLKLTIGYDCGYTVAGSIIEVVFPQGLEYKEYSKAGQTPIDSVNKNGNTLTVLQSEGELDKTELVILVFDVSSSLTVGTKNSIDVTLKSTTDDNWNEYLPNAKISVSFDVVSPPTPTPTATPTQKPTATPTQKPTATPTQKPTKTPTQKPTATPTQKPTATPTQKPTATPTQKPTKTPTQKPTATPTQKPTKTPTQKPTATPTQKPTATPTQKPTKTPNITPTIVPTTTPTDIPAITPTASITNTVPPTGTPYTPVFTIPENWLSYENNDRKFAVGYVDGSDFSGNPIFTVTEMADFDGESADLLLEAVGKYDGEYSCLAIYKMWLTENDSVYIPEKIIGFLLSLPEQSNEYKEYVVLYINDKLEVTPIDYSLNDGVLAFNNSNAGYFAVMGKLSSSILNQTDTPPEATPLAEDDSGISPGTLIILIIITAFISLWIGIGIGFIIWGKNSKKTRYSSQETGGWYR